jgi:hypothetical protein
MPGGNYESILSQKKGKIEKGTTRLEVKSTLNKPSAFTSKEDS